MKKHILIALVCASLMLITPFTVVARENKITSNIIIVDDEGDGNYTSIKEALNFANIGDIIEVYSGTYYENNISIVKDKITLKGIPNELGAGNDIGKPFIDGQGNGGIIEINAGNVIITGFQIENKIGDGHTLIYIGKDVNRCTISNNDLANASTTGIGIGGNYNRILNNSVKNCGIYFTEPGLFGPKGNLVSGNIVSDSPYFGISVDSTRNIIVNNKVMRCGRAGISNFGSYNLFRYNTMENNVVGFEQSSAFPNYINRNNFINNDEEVYLYVILFVPAFTMRTNRFSNNYWGEPRTSPYPIVGRYPFYNRTFYDWFPAQESYNIG